MSARISSVSRSRSAFAALMTPLCCGCRLAASANVFREILAACAGSARSRRTRTAATHARPSRRPAGYFSSSSASTRLPRWPTRTRARWWIRPAPQAAQAVGGVTVKPGFTSSTAHGPRRSPEEAEAGSPSPSCSRARQRYGYPRRAWKVLPFRVYYPGAVHAVAGVKLVDDPDARLVQPVPQALSPTVSPSPPSLDWRSQGISRIATQRRGCAPERRDTWARGAQTRATSSPERSSAPPSSTGC